MDEIFTITWEIFSCSCGETLFHRAEMFSTAFEALRAEGFTDVMVSFTRTEEPVWGILR